MTENVNRSAMFLSQNITSFQTLLIYYVEKTHQFTISRNGQDPTHGTATAYHMCNRALGL